MWKLFNFIQNYQTVFAEWQYQFVLLPATTVWQLLILLNICIPSFTILLISAILIGV